MAVVKCVFLGEKTREMYDVRSQVKEQKRWTLRYLIICFMKHIPDLISPTLLCTFTTTTGSQPIFLNLSSSLE